MHTSTRVWGAAFIVLVLVIFVYLIPGSTAMIEGRTDTVMSDDTDPAGLPYVYDQVLHLAKSNPSRLLYGSIYVEPTDPDKGWSVWMPWNERVAILASAPFIKIEQLPTAVVFWLLLFNGLAMFALARYLKWDFWIALGCAIAWALNPFTRARAKVHEAMSGIYHLPLIFLALLLVARGKTWRSVTGAAMCLVLACTTIHYFIVTSLFLTPFFLVFFALQPEVHANWKLGLKRLLLAAIPAVIFLGLNFTFTVPGDAKVRSKDALPRSGETPDGGLHPYLTLFAAHPIDYLAGDIALAPEAHDLNPLRQLIDEQILNNLGNGNAHERTSGIRWSILILAVIAIRSYKKSSHKQMIGFFTVFAFFGFWLSLPPDFPFAGAGPSGWLYQLIPQVRVPSRAGILVGFALLMLAGSWVAQQPKKSWLLWPSLFPALMVIDYPPLIQSIPMAIMRPRITELGRENGACGPGLYFPFVSNYHLNVLHYAFLQQMRGSDCPILNGMVAPEKVMPVSAAFPAAMEFLTALDSNLVVSDQIQKLARCVPLNWIVFDPHVPQSWREKMCAQLGWKMQPDLACVAPDHGRALERLPDQCL